MKWMCSWTVFVISLAACQHSHHETAQLYSARGLDTLAVEYLLLGLAENPEDMALREEASVLLERARWQLEDELSRVSHREAPGAVIGKWRSLQDLVQLSAAYGFVNAEAERERSMEEKRARAKVRVAVEERLDGRLSRGVPQVADLRLCREVASLDSESGSLSRTCDRMSKELMVIAALELAGASAPRLSTERLTSEIRSKRLELFLLELDSQGALANAHLKVMALAPVVDEQDWFISRRLPVRKWVERRDAEGRLVKRQVTQTPSPEEIQAAKEQGLPPPKASTTEKQVWDEVSGEYFFYERYRELRLPYRVELVNLRNSRTIYGHHGVSKVDSSRSYFQFSGDPRARERDFETVPEGLRATQNLESRDSLVSRAIVEMERAVASELARKVD